MKTVSIIGCGWLGRPLALKFMEKGYEVTGTTTSAQNKDQLQREGIKAEICDFSDSSEPADLFSSDIVIVTVPPRGKNSAEAGQHLHRAIASRLSSGPSFVVYCSSTSAYHDVEARVEEDDANHLSPVCVLESIYQSRVKELAVVRLGGLIGPGRHPSRFHKGNHLLGRPLGVVNITTLEDAIEGIVHLAEGRHSGVFNLVNPHHPPREEFYTLCAELASLNPPRFDATDLARGKIVSSNKLTQETDYVFRYENIYEALKHYPV